MTTYTEKVWETSFDKGDYRGVVEVWRSERGKLGVKKSIRRWKRPIEWLSWSHYTTSIKSTWWGRPHETWYDDEIGDVIDRVITSIESDIETYQKQDNAIDDINRKV